MNTSNNDKKGGDKMNTLSDKAVFIQGCFNLISALLICSPPTKI